MSDARNSSNSLRGGGAKQTGGSGRTNKYASQNNRSNLLNGLNGEQEHGERSEAKRKLQLLVSSKQLASNARTLLLEEHTEEEYANVNIPLPSTEDAKKKLKSMKEFTEKWYDKGFREEWLRTITGVWIAEIKAQYEAALSAAREEQQKPEGEAQSIEDIEQLLLANDNNITSEERQRLKKKLKKKKQQKAKKEAVKKEDISVID
mmetsp:Transcript_1846/g.2718  ORF Transcript_1846/g.2718 Transcript_1846/m.2718 type:complete len:205 (+) Transcript_1846:82-696(+)